MFNFKIGCYLPYNKSTIPLKRFIHSLNETNKPEITKLHIELTDNAIKNPQLQSQRETIPIFNNSLEKKMNKSSSISKHSLPPSLQYIRNLMDSYKNYVILTQMGSFYELYFEHAETYASRLNLALASRDYNHGKVLFAGFPVHQISRYLKVLVKDDGLSVVIADQFKKETSTDNDSNKFLRRVTRVVSPGTFIDEAFENLQENQYLLSINLPENFIKSIPDENMKVGLCWCDISTGEVFVQEVFLKETISAITRIRPKEILLNEKHITCQIENGKWYPEFVELKKYFIKYQKISTAHRTMDTFFRLFTSGNEQIGRKHLEIIFQTFSQKELAALRSILLYLDEHLPNTFVNLDNPQRKLSISIMQIDSRTINALELHSTIRNDSRRGSLLSTINRTVTPSGTRLLAQWLSSPSMELNEIKIRQKLVNLFLKNHDTTQMIINTINSTHDMSRILQKFSFGKGGEVELVQISKSLKNVSKLRNLIEDELISKNKITKKLLVKLENLCNSLSFKGEILDKVLNAIDINQLLKYEPQKLATNELIGELKYNGSPWIISQSYSECLTTLHNKYNDRLIQYNDLKRKYESIFMKTFQARSVMLKLKSANEYYIHITGSSNTIKMICDHLKGGTQISNEPFRIIQKSGQTLWLSHKNWTDLGFKIELDKLAIKNEEISILESFKHEFISHSIHIRKICQSLDYLDVLTSFSKLAKEKHLICPKLNHGEKLEIIGGRHLVVESSLQKKMTNKFTHNDCIISSGNTWIITGPNMGGKSTFLRQNAIIVILAQIGCFVPCTSANIGLVDKIFSRVGSADDLYNEMSTFMVEMIETSFILKGATKKSLAILDEIGRGTSGREGVGIAYAALKYLVEYNKCRSLFATHFGGEIFQLINNKCDKSFQRNVHFFKSDIVEHGNSFYYDHKLKEGVCERSDALKVAQLAGLPNAVIDIAKEVLNENI